MIQQITADVRYFHSLIHASANFQNEMRFTRSLHFNGRHFLLFHYPHLKLTTVIPYSEKWLLQEKDVLIADTAEDETVGKAIQIGNISYPLVGGLHTIVCRPNSETAPSFLAYYINSKAFHDQLLPHITGIKVSSISKKAIKATELRIPSEIEEQQAIANVLTAMDDEIKAIEDERDKMIQIREGAMDDLLTGRVRLSV